MNMKSASQDRAIARRLMKAVLPEQPVSFQLALLLEAATREGFRISNRDPMRLYRVACRVARRLVGKHDLIVKAAAQLQVGFAVELQRQLGVSLGAHQDATALMHDLEAG